MTEATGAGKEGARKGNWRVGVRCAHMASWQVGGVGFRRSRQRTPKPSMRMARWMAIPRPSRARTGHPRVKVRSGSCGIHSWRSGSVVKWGINADRSIFLCSNMECREASYAWPGVPGGVVRLTGETRFGGGSCEMLAPVFRSRHPGNHDTALGGATDGGRSGSEGDAAGAEALIHEPEEGAGAALFSVVPAHG